MTVWEQAEIARAIIETLRADSQHVKSVMVCGSEPTTDRVTLIAATQSGDTYRVTVAAIR